MLKQKLTEILICRTWCHLNFEVYWEKISDIVTQIISEEEIQHEFVIAEPKYISCNISPTKSIPYPHFMHNGEIISFDHYMHNLKLIYPTISMTETRILIRFDWKNRLFIKSKEKSLISLVARIISFDPDTQEEFLGIESIEFLDDIENENSKLLDIISNFV